LLKLGFPSVAAVSLRLLAGGRLIGNRRPDIPGIEEKKSQREKIGPIATFRTESMPMRGSEEFGFSLQPEQREQRLK
jgi:hypothetical protein